MTKEELAAAAEKHETDFLTKVRRINDFCLDYGCFFEIAWMQGAHCQSIEAYVTDPARATDTPAQKYKVINDWFTAIGYHPFSRAHFIYRAQRTPHIKEFSHHFERGLLSLYKGDFFSAAQVLALAVEGVLRLYVGANSSVIGKGLVDLIPQTNRQSAFPHFERRHAVYKEMLERFLREWFFAHTSSANLNTIPSILNRNNVAHLFGSQSFYRPADCNRLFAFFDILMEVITYEEKSTERFLGYPRNDIPEVLERSRYYSELIVPWSAWREVRAYEEQFMLENPNYETADVPDRAGIWAAFGLEDEARLKAIIAGEQLIISPLPPAPLKPTPTPRSADSGSGA